MSNDYKYPYIPYEYYGAVMMACRMIREDGFFNKDTEIAANYFDVDVDEVRKHVRKRQGAGQRGKTRKYKWYACAVYRGHMYGDEGYMDWWDMTAQQVYDRLQYLVIKATNRKNAESQLMEKFEKRWEDAMLIAYFTEYDTEQRARSCHVSKDDLMYEIKRQGVKE